MSANLFHSGVFTKEVSTFFNDSEIIYIIATRKKPTPTKPINYILAKTKGKTFYISSLYPTPKENIFNVDYQGYKFIIEFKAAEVIVSTKVLKS
jgi:hypothetical protein